MKKLLAGIAMALALMLICGTALAATPAETRNLHRMVNLANLKIEGYVRVAQATCWDDVDWLLNKVDRTVRPVFRYADRIGAKVICEYETYYIDGRPVEIDPLRVINDNKK